MKRHRPSTAGSISPARSMRGWLSCLALLLLMVGPGNWSPATTIAQIAALADRSAVTPYDLRRDEALGGHTLARHIGRTDEQLLERLRRERQISVASTYTDELTARRTVALAIEQSRQRIEAWEARRGIRPNLALNYSQSSPVGRSLARGDREARECTRVLVVLRWLEREHRWIVLTSYPEPAR